MFNWTVNDLDSWIKIDQLDVTCFIISLLNAQHVSNISTSILRSLRLICCIISWVVLLWFDVCWCYGVVRLGWYGILMRAEALVLVMWVHGYCRPASRHNSTHASTSPSLLNTDEISYPHPTPTPLHHTQDARQSIAAYKFCCQSINLKMAVRAETCSRYLCNKQHISNHQIVVFDSWLIQL